MKHDGHAVAGSPITDVIFEEKRVLLVLDDGRQLAAPLSWVGPKVVAMNAQERSQWVATADRRGVNWPSAGQTSADGALNVWTLEQDALFEAALAELKALDWKADQLNHRSRALVALWRLVADGYNGGLLQFLGNWGMAEMDAALAALAQIKASATLAVVTSFWRLVGPIAQSDEVNNIDDVYRAVAGDLSEQIEELDEQFWEAAEELVQRVPEYFGPAPSAA
ncbi:DUF4375 domain-containing protein [Comamonas sp. B-9]|uniref:DMP19 family protein n=1 Tax=Comamonas sp. B-9 TaxID=1055192 RepID=UPI00039588BF|nr:DUF4375 domain-containing protein [Comamonas sp. B-9]